MSHDFTIRATTIADLEAVTELLAASYPALMAGSYDEPLLSQLLPVICQANPTLLLSGTFYVAQTDDAKLIACGGWTPERPPGTGDDQTGLGHIRHFATHPKWLRRGLGRAIYEACEADARLQGIIEFECYSSLNAEPFYRSVGFRRVREVLVPMPNGLRMPAVLMEHKQVT
ncbi:MAG: GNAT family N-acetyltransferase [Alphaproteobacteria bacterium]|nr:GNAT family N-acetyltransferase [Alphaproteobacteria bacterium]